ncbi:carboxylate-amine ligase [Nocardiopsis ansamitocini]|uniref:Putative glutamate--cysteine ligase 2 n=1 Tax=Nocardiopsis ansamitocini TaxID=1670832 RepID=A0A9W6UIY0_9ACTN|nr:glutamate--cysteine ligase [Nocardiopsis ansamitocini]GLU48229.1 putative glutamate--cysteine ligase 2 [Nocardiopsis ansamitocini]
MTDRPATSHPTMGVEEEFLLLDSTGHLAGASTEVLPRAAEGSAELQHELNRNQVESASTVFDDAPSLMAELRGSRARLAQAAAQRGLSLAAVGAPLLVENTPALLTPGDRYARMRRELGPMLDAANTCGCHVHVSVPDAATALQVSNHLRPWLPVLLALTANSPFFEGADTGYASWRYIRWSRLPSSAPPPFFTDEKHYEGLIEELLASGAALDRGMVYWGARPSDDQPTLEVRVSDVAATVEEATLLAVLVRGLVAAFLTEVRSGVPAPRLAGEILRAHMWRAARDGLNGQCLDPATGRLAPAIAVLGSLIERVRPELERTGDLDFARSTAELLGTLGGGAHRQRLAYERAGELSDVVEHVMAATAGIEALNMADPIG